METQDYALSRGRHAAPDRGRCAMEWVAELTGERHTDRPRSTSEVAAEYVRHFNDVLADGPRQRLRPYLARMIGTADDGLDELRAWSCALRLAHECLPVALEAAGLKPRTDPAADAAGFEPRTDATADAAGFEPRTDPAADAAGFELRTSAAAQAAGFEPPTGDVTLARVAAAEARAAARERAREACVASEWSLRRERARSAARAAGRAAALDAARAALTVAAPDPERSALAETAWAATWDALWAAAWDGRPMPDASELRAGAFALLDRMLPGERLDLVEAAPARRLVLA